jgi:hypothetical protein
MSYTQQQKQVLAKLLATENITVEHRNVSTAMFDVQNRTLLLPTWESMPENVYDMLVGHEVGHAVFTPTDMNDLQTKIDGIDSDHPGRVKTLFNIVEDVRIEKKMKRKFPGLRRDFHNGYKDFLSRGLFGDAESLTRKLVDKINIHFKCGSLGPQYEFSAGEQDLVDRIGTVETFEDVAVIVKDLYEYVLGDVPDMVDDLLTPQKMEERSDCNGWEEETKKATEGSGDDSANDNKKDSADQDGSSTDGERSGDDTGDSTQSESRTDSNEKMEEKKEQKSQRTSSKQGGRGNKGNVDDNFKSDTQNAMDNFVESSYDPTMLPDLVVGIPKVDSNRFIEDYKSVLEGLDFHFNEEIYQDKWFVRELIEREIEWEEYQTILMNGYKDWKKTVSSSVNFMAKEFEMKKSADQYARASQNKTGTLNTNKIHEYRYNEDIFRRITILPDGKDHAMIMLLDWSGSMDSSIANTIQQAMTLVLFCKKVNIPFEVYCFTDSPIAYRNVIKPLQQEDYAKDDLYVDYFVLRNMFSSRMSTKDLEKAMNYIYAISNGFGYGGEGSAYSIDLGYNYSRHLIPTSWTLSGTPLNDSMIVMRDFLEKYRKDNKSTIINMIILTDGDSATSSYKISDKDDALEADKGDYGHQYIQYNDTDIQQQLYAEKMHINTKVDQFCHSQVNVRLKDPYSNTTEYISPSADRLGKYRNSWYSTEHNNMTNSLIRSLGNVPRVNVVGFFIANGKYNAKNAVSTHFFSRRDLGYNEKYEKSLKDFRKNKFLLNDHHDGYDIFFVLSGGSDLELETGGLDDTLQGESKRKLTTAFKKHSKAKLQSRVFLTKFIDYISKENF